MSEKKTAIKNKKNNKEAPEKKTKKDNEKTTDVGDKKINTDEVTSSEKVDKDKPKSASQSSISHFSSVATPAYREGWAAIFGNKGVKKKSGAKNSSISLPANFILEDEELGLENKKAIYAVLQKKLRKRGVSLAKLKKEGRMSFRVECEIIGK
ncbi:MAG: hypothetical protein ISQ90_07635 [Rhodospirillales bacterium]|nr:hypothetical protein [Rhodospirillales bacterium]